MTEAPPVQTADGGEDATVPAYAVTVDAFSGPLDLLLYLVRRTELDITQIPISEIADQFVDTVRGWQASGELDLEMAGDFVLMASTLLEIKARAVAPPPEEEADGIREDDDDLIDPRADLIAKLLAYRRFKEATAHLLRLEAGRAERAVRRLREEIPDDPEEIDGLDLGELDPHALFSAWQLIVARLGGMGPRTVARDDIPIESRISGVIDYGREVGRTTLRQLLEREPTVLGRMTTVMATLEVVRQRWLEARQWEQYGEIELRFRPPEEREAKPVLPDPEPVEAKRRRRRPPLATFSAPVPVEAVESADSSAEEEESFENDEERFLRELNEACALDRVLEEAKDWEGNFRRHWEVLHPPPPPVVAPVPTEPMQAEAISPGQEARAVSTASPVPELFIADPERNEGIPVPTSPLIPPSGEVAVAVSVDPVSAEAVSVASSHTESRLSEPTGGTETVAVESLAIAPPGGSPLLPVIAVESACAPVAAVGVPTPRVDDGAVLPSQPAPSAETGEGLPVPVAPVLPLPVSALGASAACPEASWDAAVILSADAVVAARSSDGAEVFTEATEALGRQVEPLLPAVAFAPVSEPVLASDPPRQVEVSGCESELTHPAADVVPVDGSGWPAEAPSPPSTSVPEAGAEDCAPAPAPASASGHPAVITVEAVSVASIAQEMASSARMDDVADAIPGASSVCIPEVHVGMQPVEVTRIACLMGGAEFTGDGAEVMSSSSPPAAICEPAHQATAVDAVPRGADALAEDLQVGAESPISGQMSVMRALSEAEEVGWRNAEEVSIACPESNRSLDAMADGAAQDELVASEVAAAAAVDHLPVVAALPVGGPGSPATIEASSPAPRASSERSGSPWPLVIAFGSAAVLLSAWWLLRPAGDRWPSAVPSLQVVAPIPNAEPVVAVDVARRIPDAVPRPDIMALWGRRWLHWPDPILVPWDACRPVPPSPPALVDMGSGTWVPDVIEAGRSGGWCWLLLLPSASASAWPFPALDVSVSTQGACGISRLEPCPDDGAAPAAKEGIEELVAPLLERLWAADRKEPDLGVFARSDGWRHWVVGAQRARNQ